MASASAPRRPGRGAGRRDSIDVRNRFTADEVYCGSGRDSVRADRGDRISTTCEIVRRLPDRKSGSDRPEPGVVYVDAVAIAAEARECAWN